MRRSAGRFGLAVIAFVLGGQIGGVRAQTTEGRVALVNPGEELERAVRTALEPWNVTFVIASERSPGPSAPAANRLARELALRHGAGAAVWISEHQRGYALWIYDVASNHAVSRRLTIPPPFDAPAAAAVALSLKTLLRHSASAPERERYGASTAPAPSTTPETRVAPEPPAARPVSRPSAQDEVVKRPAERELAASSERTEPSATRAQLVVAQSGRSARAKQERTATPPAHPAVPSQLDFEAATAYRVHLTRGAQEARFGVGVSWWPAAAWGGVSVRAVVGPPLAFEKPGFHGDLLDTTIGLAGRVRAQLPRGARIFAAVGAAGEVTLLRGFIVEDRARARERRVAPALTLELGADFLLSSWFRAGIRAAGAALIRPQRYQVVNQTVLELTYWSIEGMFVLGICWPS